MASSMVQAEADGQGQRVKAVWVSAMFSNCSDREEWTFTLMKAGVNTNGFKT